MKELLEEHGTKAFALPPRAIVGAASADLKLRDRKRIEMRSEMYGPNGASIQNQHYAFHRRHVARAKSAKHLIELALRFGAIGIKSSKKNTRVIYGDAKLLKRALKTIGAKK